MVTEQICLQCGACCAYYRVAFYWAESDPTLAGAVPSELTQQLDALRLVMKGTHNKPVRCTALAGEVGRGVHCTIYEQRPTPCRDLQPAWADGQPSEQCDRARLAWGLPPLPLPHLPDIGENADTMLPTTPGLQAG